MFLSVVFAFEHGISESNKDSKFECRSINDIRHNRTQWATVNKPIVNYKQSGSRKTILLLPKNVKLAIKYALLYGVTSLILRKRRFSLKISPNDFLVCREEKPRSEMNTENK